jgi:hypothetical protein
MKVRYHLNLAVCALVTVLFSAELAAAPIIFTSSGPDATSIQSTVDAFRVSLGVLNPNTVGSFGSGRREINWDGVPDVFSAPNDLPANFFNVNSPRGIVIYTPGYGLQVSANSSNPTSTPIEFANIDPSYPRIFSTFSPQRLFTGRGSNVVDVNFFVSGTTTPAFTSGFGAVFTDVDLANTTSIQFFDANNLSIGTFFANPGGTPDESLSFLGIDFDDPIISKVRITSGNSGLGAGSIDRPGWDLVVMDDFIYGEPVARVPEPHTIALIALGLLGMYMGRRNVRKKSYVVGKKPLVTPFSL